MRVPVVAVLASVAATLVTSSFVACSSSSAGADGEDSGLNDPWRTGCSPPPQVSTVTAQEACAVIEASTRVGLGYGTGRGYPRGDGYECTFDAEFSKLLPSRDPVFVDPADTGSAADASPLLDASLSDAGDGEAPSRDASADAATDGGSGFVCPDYAAPIIMTCTSFRPCGRPYEGYVSEPVGPSARAYLVSCMGMEAASVAAFHVLEHELRDLGAPEPLLRACRDAARDEIRHAERMGELVGQVPTFPNVVPRGRSLLEIALENARIGMVRETYGAVVAKVQGARAESASLREVWSTIGDDEIGHAGLAWEIGAFLSTCLDAKERAIVSSAMRDEVAALSSELSAAPSREHIEVGVPDVATARGIVAALRGSLWDRADLAA